MKADDSLYFGEVAVTFKTVEGWYFDYSTCEISTSNDDTLQEEFMVKEIGANTTVKLVVPYVPAVHLVADMVPTQVSNGVDEWLTSPLLKQKDGTLLGIQSGRRSSLLQHDGKWYRFKGCGDLYDGFPIQLVPDEKDLFELRGSMFEQTCLREQHMTSMINKMLSTHGFRGCNIPIGWWQYKSSSQTVVPDIPRYCAIYETFGDRRLGDHVLLGIEMLLAQVLTNVQTTLSMVHQRLQVANRASAATDETPTETWMHLIADVGEWASGKLAHLDLAKTLATVIDCKIPLKLSDGPSMDDTLVYLYARFGSEIGQILSVLDQNNVSWGTYKDRLGTHCNAHPNNLVISHRSICVQQRNFLMALDFDMAFTEPEYRQNLTNSVPFAECKNLERSGMLMALAGDQLNTGTKPYQSSGNSIDTIRTALRDTLCRSFLEAYCGEKVVPWRADLLDSSLVLIELALKHTSANIA